jgi:membrane-anchored protein YejM (alkaline phosphatase superfamily)
MELIDPVGRVVLVILDGLRADAIDTYALPNLIRLRRAAAFTTEATTIEPSVTWAAMTSLMTGVSPAMHGVVSDTIQLPRPRTELHPLPSLLAEHGLPSTAMLASIPRLFKAVAALIGRRLGVGDLRFAGTGAEEILSSARDRLDDQRRGLIFLHWPDADRAGHDFGWMTTQYQRAAIDLDRSLGRLLDVIDLDNDPDTLLIALADHGGGGVDPRDHMTDHRHDRTIPMCFAGPRVVPGDLGPGLSLLDVPPTILWALGIERPSNYDGRPLSHLLRRTPPVVGAVA